LIICRREGFFLKNEKAETVFPLFSPFKNFKIFYKKQAAAIIFAAACFCL